jgi:WhiB family transcriptional regulator, redox-sensing transcriptional regulator
VKPVRECPVCGRGFVPDTHRRRYCSTPCATQVRKDRERARLHSDRVPKQRTCVGCGTDYTPARMAQRYCTLDCRTEHLTVVAASTTPRPDDDWREYALCRGVEPDIFFPTRGEDSEAAKAVCRNCPVRLECLDYALSARELFGVWGGLSERERREVRRKRRRGAA